MGPGAPGPDGHARRLSPLTPVARAPIVLLAVLGASWQTFTSGPTLLSLGAVAVLLLAGAVWGWVSWLRTTYWIHDDELRIDTGVVSRQSRRIRIDRLQGIDVVQPLVARLMGLAELHLDTASGSRRDGSLAFLPYAEAVALRAQLLRRRDDVRAARTRPPGAPAAAGAPGALGPSGSSGPAPYDVAPGAAPLPDDPAPPSTWPAAPEPVRELARLDLGLLLLSTLLSPATLGFLVGGAGLLLTSMLTGAPVFAGGVVPALIGSGLAAFRAFSAAYGFVLSESGEGLAVRRGLTSVTAQTVPLPRVQGVVVSEPVLWRRFGWARLEVSVAGGVTSGDETFSASTLLPVGPRDQVLWLARHTLGDDPTTVDLLPPPRRARWSAPLTWWTLAFGQDDRFTVSRRGWWTRRFDVVPQRKVQSVRVTQGPWQRRLDLATLHVDSPVGRVAVSAPGRASDEARALAASAVERSRRARHEPA